MDVVIHCAMEFSPDDASHYPREGFPKVLPKESLRLVGSERSSFLVQAVNAPLVVERKKAVTDSVKNRVQTTMEA